MIQLFEHGVYLLHGETLVDETDREQLTGRLGAVPTKDDAKKGTMAYSILKAHNTVDNMEQLSLKFDSMTSHDITYVGIIQTARASGMKEFPLPYVLTNCHNSLCAVGGTINEDDHMFALSAAKKYGGIYVPTNLAVIHSYNREMMSGCGRIILVPTPTPATAPWAPWPWGRAAVSWPSSWWAAPMTWGTPKSSPSTLPASRKTAWALRMWP